MANPALAGASVSFFTVDPVTFAKTTTLATLYAALSGPDLLSNPQVLDSHGKFQDPVYHEGLIVATVDSEIPDFDTGVIIPLHELIYDTAIVFTGLPLANERIWTMRYVRDVQYLAAFSGSDGYAHTVATAEVVFDVRTATPPAALASIGSITFAAGATQPTFSLAADTTIADGDLLEVLAPAVQDVTFGDFTITLRGTRV